MPLFFFYQNGSHVVFHTRQFNSRALGQYQLLSIGFKFHLNFANDQIQEDYHKWAF